MLGSDPDTEHNDNERFFSSVLLNIVLLFVLRSVFLCVDGINN